MNLISGVDGYDRPDVLGDMACPLLLLFIKNQCQLTGDLVPCLHVPLFFRYNSTNRVTLTDLLIVFLLLQLIVHCLTFTLDFFFPSVVFSYF